MGSSPCEYYLSAKNQRTSSNNPATAISKRAKKEQKGREKNGTDRTALMIINPIPTGTLSNSNDFDE